MSVAQVFSLPELRELILLGLPLRRIILARHICSGFDATLKRSKKIRQALWLEPASTQKVEWYSHPKGGGDWAGARNTGDWKLNEDSDGVVPIANPFIAMFNNFRQQWYRKRLAGLYFDANETIAFSGYWSCRVFTVHFPQFDRSDDSELEFPDEHVEGSFKGMVVSHPPPRSVTIHVRAEGKSIRVASSHSRGLDLLTLIRNAVRACVNAETVGSAFMWVTIVGGEKWRMLSGTVDEITGWEMLRILHADAGELHYVDDFAYNPSA
ncbi:hypothetical protein LTR85_006580 [Meristemomyces frigidus]|nr:hypothetical protein LTR85_006580 [Meristemomyces frigidus]